LRRPGQPTGRRFQACRGRRVRCSARRRRSACWVRTRPRGTRRAGRSAAGRQLGGYVQGSVLAVPAGGIEMALRGSSVHVGYSGLVRPREGALVDRQGVMQDAKPFADRGDRRPRLGGPTLTHRVAPGHPGGDDPGALSVTAVIQNARHGQPRRRPAQPGDLTVEVSPPSSLRHTSAKRRPAIRASTVAGGGPALSGRSASIRASCLPAASWRRQLNGSPHRNRDFSLLKAAGNCLPGGPGTLQSMVDWLTPNGDLKIRRSSVSSLARQDW